MKVHIRIILLFIILLVIVDGFILHKIWVTEHPPKPPAAVSAPKSPDSLSYVYKSEAINCTGAPLDCTDYFPPPAPPVHKAKGKNREPKIVGNPELVCRYGLDNGDFRLAVCPKDWTPLILEQEPMSPVPGNIVPVPMR